MHEVGRLDPDEFWSVLDDTDGEVRRGFADRPAYTVSGWHGATMLGEWSFGSGIRAVTCIADGVLTAETGPRVEVMVDDLEPRAFVAERRAFAASAAGSDERPPRSLPGSLPGSPPARSPFAVGPSAPDEIIDIPVDGVAEPFELWVDGDRAWAAGRIGPATVVVVAIGHPMADVALERVLDVEPLLAARRRWIRAMRSGV